MQLRPQSQVWQHPFPCVLINARVCLSSRCVLIIKLGQRPCMNLAKLGDLDMVVHCHRCSQVHNWSLATSYRPSVQHVAFLMV